MHLENFEFVQAEGCQGEKVERTEGICWTGEEEQQEQKLQERRQDRR